VSAPSATWRAFNRAAAPTLAGDLEIVASQIRLALREHRRGGTTSMKLSFRAYQLCCEILRIIATTPPSEISGRIEDVIHDALAEFRDDIRRATRREFTE
jgi:hypothetical protein